MDVPTGRLSLEKIWQDVDESLSKPMTEQEGYRWGIDYLQDIKKELLKLEAQAKIRNDPNFFNSVRSSMLRALEVEEELEGKIKVSE